ncbi:hypothetical protein P0F38_002852 [Vibrio metschnikovii]|nr:hypothetical protein [Vibrio metschnikovii]
MFKLNTLHEAVPGVDLDSLPDIKAVIGQAEPLEASMMTVIAYREMHNANILILSERERFFLSMSLMKCFVEKGLLLSGDMMKYRLSHVKVG